MNITFYRVSDPDNKINKTLSGAVTLQGLVKHDEVSFQRVSILISNGTVRNNYNYLGISIGGRTRYYYIRNIEYSPQNGVLAQITAEEDVLMTWKNEILNSTGLIQRSGNMGNLYYDDGTYKLLNNKRQLITNFGRGFLDTPEYILITAGGLT